MSRLLPIALVTSLLFSVAAHSQVGSARSVVSSQPAISVTEDAAPAKNSAEEGLDPASLVPGMPSLPAAKSTLVGGIIDRLDRVQDRLTVRVFGGGKMNILFDPRTHIYRDGEPASASDLRKGDRVYIDTMLDGANVFARNIRLKKSTTDAESQGVVLSYHPDRGELTMRDVLSPDAFKVRFSSSTRILQGGRAVSPIEITPGTLVAVKLGAQQDGHDWAREISLLAAPGASFTFAGQVTSLDLRMGLLVLTSTTDRKSYEIYFDPSVLAIDDNLHPGTDVTILTRFEGNKYLARSLTINPSPERSGPNQ
jgi:hypothetical protein